MPVFRKLLPKNGMAFLDQKGPKSMEELLDTLQQWWTRGRPSADVSKPKTVPSRFAHTHGFSCGKMGHRAFECRSRSSTSSHSPAAALPPPVAKADSSMVTCFSCGRKGHKAPACPDRVGGHRSTSSVTPKDSSCVPTDSEANASGEGE